MPTEQVNVTIPRLDSETKCPAPKGLLAPPSAVRDGPNTAAPLL